jgi:hypothetical protein
MVLVVDTLTTHSPGFLDDADGRERFIVTISSMHHDVARMMVITHIKEMNDRVPTIIDRHNTARGSRWEIRSEEHAMHQVVPCPVHGSERGTQDVTNEAEQRCVA